MLENGNLEVSSDQHFFRIGQVCRLTDIKSFTLRYWESEFPSLQPVKSSKGQRLYRREDVETVLRIKRLLYDEGFTIAGARRYLRDLDNGPAQDPAPSQAAADFEPDRAVARREPLSQHFESASALPEEEDEADSQFIGSSGGSAEVSSGGSANERHEVAPAATARAVAPPPSATPVPAGKDASAMLSRKLLLDLRDSLRAFLTLLENE